MLVYNNSENWQQDFSDISSVTSNTTPVDFTQNSREEIVNNSPSLNVSDVSSMNSRIPEETTLSNSVSSGGLWDPSSWFQSTGDGNFTTPWNPTGKPGDGTFITPWNPTGEKGDGGFVTPWNPTGATTEELQNEWILNQHPDGSFEDQNWGDRSIDRIRAAYETGWGGNNPLLGSLDAGAQMFREGSDVFWATVGEGSRVAGASLGGYDAKSIDTGILQSKDLIAKIETALSKTSDPEQIAFWNRELATVKNSLDVYTKQKQQVSITDFEDRMRAYEKSDFVGKDILSESALMLATMKLPSIPFAKAGNILKGSRIAAEGTEIAVEGTNILNKGVKIADAAGDVGRAVERIGQSSEIANAADFVVDASGNVMRIVKEIPSDAAGIFKLADEVIDSSRHADDVIDILRGIEDTVQFMSAEDKAIASAKYLKLLDKFADAGLYYSDSSKMEEARKIVGNLPNLVEDLNTPAGKQLMEDLKILQNFLNQKAGKAAIVDDAVNLVKQASETGTAAGAKTSLSFGSRTGGIPTGGGATDSVSGLLSASSTGGGGRGLLGAGNTTFINVTRQAAKAAVDTSKKHRGLNVVREVVGNTVTTAAGGTIAAVGGGAFLKDDDLYKTYAKASQITIDGKGKVYSSVNPDSYNKMIAQYESKTKDLSKWAPYLRNVDPKTGVGTFVGSETLHAAYLKDIEDINKLAVSLEAINKQNAELLKDYLIKDSNGEVQINIAKLMKEKGETNATLLLAVTGNKPEIPKDIYAKLDEKSKQYYTEGKNSRMSSLVYSDKWWEKPLGYIGRFEEQVRQPFEEGLKKYQTPIADVPVLGMIDPVNFALGVGEVLDPWSAVDRNYATMGSNALWGATPFAGPAIRSWQAVGQLPSGATLEQNVGAWGGAILTTGLTALPIVGGPIGNSAIGGWLRKQVPTGGGKISGAIGKFNNAMARPVGWVNENIMNPIGDAIAPISKPLESRLTQIKLGELGEKGSMWGWWADQAVPSPLNPIKTVAVPLEGGGEQIVFKGIMGPNGKRVAGYTYDTPNYVVDPATGRLMKNADGTLATVTPQKKFVWGNKADDLFLPDKVKGTPLASLDRMKDIPDANILGGKAFGKLKADALMEQYGFKISRPAGADPEVYPVSEDVMASPGAPLGTNRRIADEWKPSTKLEEQIFTDEALNRIYTPEGVSRLKAAKEAIRLSEKARFGESGFTGEVKMSGFGTMDDKTARELYEATRQSGYMDLGYGSWTFADWRKKGDLDWSLYATTNQTKKVMQDQMEILIRRYGSDNVRVNPAGEFTIQRKMPDVRNADGTITRGEWKNVVDNHPAGTYSYDPTVEMAFGRNYAQNPTVATIRAADVVGPNGVVTKGEIIGQVPIMRFSEASARKWGAISGYQYASTPLATGNVTAISVVAPVSSPSDSSGPSFQRPSTSVSEGEFYEIFPDNVAAAATPVAFDVVSDVPLLKAPSSSSVVRRVVTLTPDDGGEVPVRSVVGEVVSPGRSVAEISPSRAVVEISSGSVAEISPSASRSLAELFPSIDLISPSSSRFMETISSSPGSASPSSASPSSVSEYSSTSASSSRSLVEVSPSSSRSVVESSPSARLSAPRISPYYSPYSSVYSPYSPYSPSPYSPYSPSSPYPSYPSSPSKTSPSSPYSPSKTSPGMGGGGGLPKGGGGGGTGASGHGGEGSGPALNPIFGLTDPVSLVMPRWSFMGQSIGSISNEDLTDFGVSKSDLTRKRSHDYVTYLAPVSKQIGSSVFAPRGGGSIAGGAQGFASDVTKSTGQAIGKAVTKIAKKVVG